MPKLNSSMISRADYEPESRTLTVAFTSGAVWTYANVDEATADGLLGASSPGKYFLSAIKGRFAETRAG